MYINKKTTPAIVLVCTLCFIGISSVFAQNQSKDTITTTQKTSDRVSAFNDAMLDAHIETNSLVWFGTGCILGPIGWIIATSSGSHPPASRLIGKSPEYVALYIRIYKKEAHYIKTKQGTIGCVVGSVATAVIVAFYMFLGMFASGMGGD
jgi:hypothetical protein